MSSKFYVYFLLNPLNFNLPFYVGKGQRDRAHSHFQPKSLNRTDPVNNYKNNTIKRIIEITGKNPPVEIYITNLSNEEACHFEKEYIAFFGKKIEVTWGVLTNLTDGGEGSEGYIHTEESKRKMSQSHLGRSYWYGNRKPKSEEIKEKMRKPKSEEHKEKMRKPKSEEGKANIKKAHEKFKNKIVAIDMYGERILVGKDDPRWLSGELVGQTKGRQIGKDNPFYGKTHSKEFLKRKSEQLKGLISAKDIHGNFFRITKDDPRWLSGELVGIKKKSSAQSSISIEDNEVIIG